jgi:hypothetical protein
VTNAWRYTKRTTVTAAPRCEALTRHRRGEPATRCKQGGNFIRDGRRVCASHLRAERVSFANGGAGIEFLDGDAPGVRLRKR